MSLTLLILLSIPFAVSLAAIAAELVRHYLERRRERRISARFRAAMEAWEYMIHGPLN